MASYRFDDLVQAIAIAIMHGVRVSERQHHFLIGEYFEEDNEGVLTPRTRKVRIPSSTVAPGGKGSDAYEIVDLPLVTLVPLQSLKVEKVKVSFKASIREMETIDKPHDNDIDPGKKPLRRSRLSFELTGGRMFRKQNQVSVEIVMGGSDPPEGIVRLNDQILKDIDTTSHERS